MTNPKGDESISTPNDDIKNEMVKEKSVVFLIRSTSKSKQRFDFLIIICVIFNCFTIPVELSFDPVVMR